MIAVILCSHCTVQSCVNDVTVFGIIPKSHEKYSWAVVSAAELCQLSLQAGSFIFSFSQDLSQNHRHVDQKVSLDVSNPASRSIQHGQSRLWLSEP